MAIDVVDLIPANPSELFGYRAQANTNRMGAQRSIIELSRMFDYQTIYWSTLSEIALFTLTRQDKTRTPTSATLT